MNYTSWDREEDCNPGGVEKVGLISSLNSINFNVHLIKHQYN